MNRRLKKPKPSKTVTLSKLKHHVIEQVKNVDDRHTLQRLSETLEYSKRNKDYAKNARRLRKRGDG